MATSLTTKQQLRDAFISRRDALSSELRAEQDRQIKDRFKQLHEYEDAEVVFCYVSIDSEVDTRELISEMLQEGKLVCAPRCTGKGEMHALEINSVDDLKSGVMGIPAPRADALRITPEDIDLIVVPGLSCTREGYRLGYGGGYYDRYLAKAEKAHKVMLCRDSFVSDALPVESHDTPVDIIVSNKEIIFP